MQIRSLLFVGRRNAARSIMAESCFNAASIIGWRAFSAGWQSQESVDSTTKMALAHQGFPVDSLYSKPVDIFRQAGAPKIDLCIFLDDHLPADADLYPGSKEYWRIGDPSGKKNGDAAYAQALGIVTARVSGLILSGNLQDPVAELRAAS
jgi:protein-tyrosine-phosphatase